MPKPNQKLDELQQRNDDLTADLQRTRADFENFRKRTELEREAARRAGRISAIQKLLPIIDTIERAVTYLPEHLQDDKWAQGVVGLAKSLEKSLEQLDLQRIAAKPGTPFDPDHHEAIQFDEDATGEQEVIAEELQPGYKLDGHAIRPAMVKVTRQ